MKQAALLRENTRILQMNLDSISRSDCCCCRGISDTQCFVLVEIGRCPGISVKRLAEILRLDKSGISRTVEELVQKELVERNASEEDRRYVVLNLTDKGNAKFSRIEKDMNRKFEDVLERIPAEKRGMVIEALKLYNAALETDEPAN